MKIYSKGGILLADVPEAPYSGSFMGERFVSCTVLSDHPIEFLPGDYVDFRGEQFILDYTPTPKKTSSIGSVGDAFQHELKFISIADKELRGCLFRNIFLNDNRLHPASPIADVFADAKLLANMIQASLNEEYKEESQWTITVLKDTEARQINVQDILCWDAVALFKSEYNLNFTIKGRNVTVGTVGKLVDHIFKYGSNNGLTEITPTAQNSDKIITKLSAFGGNRNLPKDYSTYAESPTLMLPEYKITGEDYIISEDGVKNYGIKPDVFRDEEIYPSIHGVTADDLIAAGIKTNAVGRVDEIVYMEAITKPDQATFNVWIKDIGFDVNDYKTSVPMLISMRDGWVGGNEFELVRCVVDESKIVEVDGETWTSKYKLTLNRNDNSNIILPDDKTYIRTGDHFVLLEIYMPDVYVKAAEQRLLTKAKKYLGEYDHVKASYSIKMDKVFMAYHPTIGDTIYEGDLIRVVDEDLKLDREIIIQNLNIKTGGTVPEYEVTLSDNPIATTLDRVQDNISDIEQNVTANKVDGIKEARQRAIELQLLKANIFDPDGNIKDTFLQTMMLQVGANSMNYQMGKTTARPNLVNMSFTNTSINLGADDLVHFAFGSGEEIASTWHITTPFSGSGLIPEKTYFVAIKASRDNLTAEWIVDENTYGSESVSGYYIFNFGILSAVTEGQRFFSETRGNIYAYGDELSAGLISSIDRYSWFNLNTGDFQLYNKKTGQGLQFKDGILTLGTFNPETGKFNSSIGQIENDLKDASAAANKAQEDLATYQETTNQTLETLNIITDDLQDQVDGSIMAWDGDYVPTLSNYPASEWTTDTEKTRHKGDYFDRTFLQGSEKVTERYKFVLDGGVYRWVQIADSSSALALSEAREALGIAGTKAKLFYGDSTPIAPYDINDAWWKTNGDTLLSNAKRSEGFGQLQSDWKLVNNAQSRLVQMASDDVISKEEKATLRNEKSQIDKEFTKYQADAITYGVSITALQNAYNALVNFLNGTVKITENTDFTFSGLEQKSHYNQLFADYYTNKASFSNEIAKKISDSAIDNLKMGGVNYFPTDSDFWEQGGINANNGIIGSSNNRIRTKDYISFYGSSIAIKNYNSKYDIIVLFYKEDKTFITSTYIILGINWISDKNILTIPSNTAYFKILIREITDINITPSSASDRKFMIELGNKYSDWSPSLADQKAQSEAIAQAKADLAKTEANAYADGIVTEAESNAIAEAQKKVDDLEVGVVNIFNHSGNFTNTIQSWYNNGGGLTIDTGTKYDGYNTLRTVPGSGGICSDWYKLENGVEYCYFAIIKTNADVIGSDSAPIHYHAGKDNQSQNKIKVIKADTSFKAGVWKLAWLVFKLTEDADSFRSFIYLSGGSTVFNIAFLGLTRGNKPMSSWYPSISDTQSEIKKIKEESDSKPNTFINPNIPFSARKNDTWYNGTTQVTSLYTYVCISTYTSGGTISNWLLVADNTGTTIENGLITTGTIYLRGGASADKLQVRAGISGSGNTDNSVRFWAGGTLAEANALVDNPDATSGVAGVAITQDGYIYTNKLIARNANVSGNITSNSIQSGNTSFNFQANSSSIGIYVDFYKTNEEKITVPGITQKFVTGSWTSTTIQGSGELSIYDYEYNRVSGNKNYEIYTKISGGGIKISHNNIIKLSMTYLDLYAKGRISFDATMVNIGNGVYNGGFYVEGIQHIDSISSRQWWNVIYDPKTGLFSFK